MSVGRVGAVEARSWFLPEASSFSSGDGPGSRNYHRWFSLLVFGYLAASHILFHF